jgi:hypothetical protein
MTTPPQKNDALERHAAARQAYEAAREPIPALHERLNKMQARHREALATAREARDAWREALEASSGEATAKAKGYLTQAREAEELATELLRMIQQAEQQLQAAQVTAADARKAYRAAHAKAEAQQQREALKEAMTKLQGTDAARAFARAAAPTWTRIPADVANRPSYGNGVVSGPLALPGDLREQFKRDVRSTRLETLFGSLLDQVAAAAEEGAGDALEIELLAMLPGETDSPDVVSPIARHARRHAA